MKKSILILVLFVAAQVVAFCLATVIHKAWGQAAGMPSEVSQGVSVLVCYLLLLPVLAATGLVRRRPFVPLRLRSRWAAVAALAGLLMAGLGLNLLLEPLGLDDGGQMDAFNAMKGNPFCLLLLCLVGPLTEEVVFREGIQRQLAARGLPPAGAALVAALAFALVHGNPAQALPAALLGFLLGLLYVRTGDIRLCFPAHVLNNGLAVFFLFRPDLEPGLSSGGVARTLAVGGFWLLAGIGLIALWWPHMRLQGSGRRPESGEKG